MYTTNKFELQNTNEIDKYRINFEIINKLYDSFYIDLNSVRLELIKQLLNDINTNDVLIQQKITEYKNKIKILEKLKDSY